MIQFSKKDKRYNNYYDNYTNRYKETMIAGFLLIALVGVCFGLYKLIEYLFL